MLRLLLAVPLLAVPLAASAEIADSSRWGLARTPGSCMLHAVSPNGTNLQIWGFAGQGRIGFLLQNPDWEALREGERYALQVDFIGVRAWPVEATARLPEGDGGPGLFFTVEPGDRPGGAAFLDALASAKGMAISRDGTAVDHLPLAGSRDALAVLARCMAEFWAAPRAPAELRKQASETPAPPTA